MGKKITQLATITEVADDDLLIGVDISDTSGSDDGTNKKFTKASLLSNLEHGAEVDNPSSGVHGVTGDVVGTTDTQTLTNKTLTAPALSSPTISGAWDGWISAGETWTYASATTITVPSGATSRYQKGDKIKLTQTTTKYFYIVSVADTVLTVTGGSDYTVANATISNNFYSKVESPQGFPPYFNWTATITCPGGTAPTYSTNSCSFSISGGFCLFTIYLENSSGGTAGASANPIFCTKPMSASTTKSLGIHGVFSYYEQDVTTLASGVLRGGNGTSTFYFMLYNGINLGGADQSSTTRQLFAEGKFPI